MELSNNNTIIPINTTTVKTPDAETEAPARIIQQNKPFSITNGVLKRHNHQHSAPVAVVYKECLKNHAATMGGHAVDGCGEFMPSPNATATDPTSLKCAACGCHRNFHRRDPEEPFPPPNTAAALEYQPHHRHHPPPPLLMNRGSGDHSCPNSPSPPPISSAYYPPAPHMLLALSSGLSGRPVENNTNNNHLPINPYSSTPVSNPNGRKRFRTKFTQNQKERMLEFAERVGWRMQKQDKELINKLCHEISVEKGVLKVWMHNNKNNFGRKDSTTAANNDINGIDFGISSRNDNNNEQSQNNIISVVATNGSSSS